jgi:hypothetical protein
VKNIITENQISELSIEEQLHFYKKHFGYQHCELDGCGNEVHDDWTLFNDELYCESCFDFMMEQEKEDAKKEISKLQKQIDALKMEFNL